MLVMNRVPMVCATSHYKDTCHYKDTFQEKLMILNFDVVLFQLYWSICMPITISM